MKKIMSIMVMVLLMATMVFAGGTNSHMVDVNNGKANGDGVTQSQQNWERFQERHQFTCESPCSVDLEEADNNQTRVRVTNQLRFMWFDVESEDTYEIDSEGEVKSQKRNVWAWMHEKGWAKER